ncbi:TonB-dependent receptor [Denitromonas sp.]|uniref:TonB-dependent receptor n=1 Tax=Denitromonas sp. TaxID=2734609 RepID=UPI003A84E0A0
MNVHPHWRRLCGAALAITMSCAMAQEAAISPQFPVLDVVTVTSVTDAPPPGQRLLSSEQRHDPSATDTAALLDRIPGLNSYGAGGISSLPSVRGLADDRIRTQVDGMDLMAACPNHMNPALSYMAPSSIDEITVYAGVAPVSLAGDSIGGAISVESTPPVFAGPDQSVVAQGELGAFTRSNGDARGNHLRMAVANQKLHLGYEQSTARADNYRAAEPFKQPGFWQMLGARTVAQSEVASSGYDSADTRRMVLAAQPMAGQRVVLSVSEQTVDVEGFPNQRMDMVVSEPSATDPTQYVLNTGRPANRNRLMDLAYTGQFDWGEAKAKLYRQRVNHHMDLLQTRFIGMYMPMDSTADTLGGRLEAAIDLGEMDIVRAGAEFQRYRLDDWWPPIGVAGSMCCNEFWNIHDGRRNRFGLFLEADQRWGERWRSVAGVRVDWLRSATGRVNGYNTSYGPDAERFNAGPRSASDRHLDASLLLDYAVRDTIDISLGLARKTRSPNLHERYAWSTNPMAALMNNFVGDGNAYIGNARLSPEVAHTVSLGLDWHDAPRKQWGLKATAHLTHVKDYIDAQRCPASLGAICSTTNAQADDRYVILQYVNQSARLWGLDVEAWHELGSTPRYGSFAVRGKLSYLRGKNTTTGDHLYHIMPLNSSVALTHRRGGWSSELEVEVVAAKHRVSGVRNEVTTDGYTLLNLAGAFQWRHLRVGLALKNALNSYYEPPLGGAYVAQGNSMTTSAIPWGMAVPGPGRSFNVDVTLSF